LHDLIILQYFPAHHEAGRVDHKHDLAISPLHITRHRRYCTKIAIFQRDSSTGALSGASTTNALDGAAVVTGVIAGFAATTGRLFVAIAGASSAGGLVVLDVDCVLLTPAPTPAPTEVPSPAPTEGG